MYLGCIKFINSVSLNLSCPPGPQLTPQLGKNCFIAVA